MWWYILENNIPQEGINDEQIIDAVRSGRVGAATLLANSESREWHRADEYQFLCGELQKADSNNIADPYTGRMRVVSDRQKPQEPQPADSKKAGSPVAGNFLQEEEADPVLDGDLRRCPHCWKNYSTGKVLYIAQHPSLYGDTLLPDEQQRFLPQHFTSGGQAIDAGGIACSDMACPHCHLRLPATTVDLDSFFYSIVGAPASGKSYFLTSMIHTLKSSMSGTFDVDFADADPVGNVIVTGYENRLFCSGTPQKLTSLEKTQLAGDMYNTIQIAGRQVNLPKPFVYKMHSQWPTASGLKDWNVIFYDNAGEHFQPGADNFFNPGSRHLVNSDGIIFLFDPTADVRFRNRIAGNADTGGKIQNQMSLLDETIARLRRYQSVSADGKYSKPFVVAVSKYDAWAELSPLALEDMLPQAYDEESNMAGCNAYLLENISFYTREILLKYVPEFVAAVEAGASDVMYLPNSSLGSAPELDSASGAWGVRPANIKPLWVEAPFLWLLMRARLLNEFRKMPDEKTVKVEKFTLNDDYVIFNEPVQQKRMRLPRSWCGRLITNHAAGCRFIVPGATADAENGQSSEELWSKLQE